MANEDEPKPERRVEVPNLWALGDDRNPYLHNTFVLLGIHPDDPQGVTDRSFRLLPARVKKGRTVHGRLVQDIDLSRFEQLMAQTAEYATERLLVHTAHKIDQDRFRPLTAALDAVPLGRPEDLLPLTVRDPSFLTDLLPEPPEVAAGEAAAVPREALAELFRPAPPEPTWDL